MCISPNLIEYGIFPPSTFFHS